MILWVNGHAVLLCRVLEDEITTTVSRVNTCRTIFLKLFHRHVLTAPYIASTVGAMAKIAFALRIEPELLEGLATLQRKLEHKPTKTTLVEDAIRTLLERHGVLRPERKRASR